MFGLAGKTMIVDEVHACDPYMQGLLRQLLRWLGRLGTPVVLLSATVTGPAARQLITAYLEGALGKRRAAGPADKAEVHYPGWIYADAADGVVTGVRVQAPARLPLRVELRQIASRAPGGAGAAVPDRQAGLRELAGWSPRAGARSSSAPLSMRHSRPSASCRTGSASYGTPGPILPCWICCTPGSRCGSAAISPAR
jgi:hypothetical protein